MVRALVTGGASLVGSHLVDRLLDRGDEVIAVDDLSRGSFANLAHLKRAARFAFVEHDVSETFRAEVDRVFHVAVPSTRAGCEADPVRAAMTCVAGTLHVLEVAESNAARLVIVVSSERWGPGVRCAEMLAFDFARTRDLDVRVVRSPGVYGPRMAPSLDHVVSALILSALRGEELCPGRAQAPVRLAYVDDVVETLVRTMDGDLRVPPVGAPATEMTPLEVAAHVASAFGGAARVTQAPSSVDSAGSPPEAAPPEPRPTLAETVPAAVVFGLAPSDPAEGIARTVRWFEARTRRDHPPSAARRITPRAG